MNTSLIGKVFTNLKVEGFSSVVRKSPNAKPLYICRCLCGKTREVSEYDLLSGHIKSCGCLHKKYNFSNKERLYQIWKNMRRRCSDSTNKRWNSYGGKGIKVCEEWNDYRVFREWSLSHGYSDVLSIDRIDINGNYCPENCRWADAKTQANNTSRNVYFVYKGERLTKSQLAEKLGLSYCALQHRLDRGWDWDRIINQKQRSY